MFFICHSHYSLQTGVVSPRSWVQAALRHGYRTLALADLNGLYGGVEFFQEGLKAGIRPILGAQLQVPGEGGCVVLVPSGGGYRQLCRLLTARHTSASFSLGQIGRQDVDQLIFLARSPLVLQFLVRCAGPGNLYVLAPVFREPFPAQLSLWEKSGEAIPQAYIPDCWLLEESDRVVFSELRRLRQLSGRNQADSTQDAGRILPTAAEWSARYPNTRRMEEIEQRCAFMFEFGKPLLPRIRVPAGITSTAYLRAHCRRNLPAKYAPDARRRQASARLERELEAIVANGFADYFLYVKEIIDFAHRRRIPVGVRGSAASSIVSYLLGFTYCCPLENDLYFERFMNPGRKDCPDIDIDIADNRRDEVIRFCYERWGEDHVAMVATIQFYRARGALRDAARILRVPAHQISALLDSEHVALEHPEMFRIAAHLAGKPRHLGIHCGGLLITPCPITDITPLARAPKGILISHYEKDQAEAIGLVKMDLLGNSALSLIAESMYWLRCRGRSFGEPGPVSDYKVRRLFANGDTLGVYQCESPGMRQLCRSLAPQDRREVSMALSLIRPGPAAAGMKEAFIRRKRGLDPVTYAHPRMADFLHATYGVMLYQEDVMNVAVNLAGYTMGDADNLRRTIGKSNKNPVFENEKHRFVFQKAPAAGLSPENAGKVWERVSRFASYAYCKAHATVYGRLAWLTARLKAHHPKEFYAALLNHHKSMYPLRVFVWDAIRHGVPILPPSVTRSAVGWIPVQRGVRAGLAVLNQIPRSVLQAIVGEREREPFSGLGDFLNRIRLSVADTRRLIMVGACSDWGSREALLRQLAELGHRGRQGSLFPVTAREALPPPAWAQLIHTGIPFARHPVPVAAESGYCRAAEMGNKIGRTVTMRGILNAVKCLHVGKGELASGEKREMSFVTLEDESGAYDVVLFPDVHGRLGGLFGSLGPYLVRGTIRCQWDCLSLELQAAEWRADLIFAAQPPIPGGISRGPCRNSTEPCQTAPGYAGPMPPPEMPVPRPCRKLPA